MLLFEFQKCNGYGRDTRFKGQKRVAVDFTSEDKELIPEKIVKSSAERRVSSCSEKGVSTAKESGKYYYCIKLLNI